VDKSGVKLVATFLYVGSFVVFVYGRIQDPFVEHGSPDWSAVDYAACVMFVFALGCSLAAFKLKDEDEDS
jgi:hypothetical protein